MEFPPLVFITALGFLFFPPLAIIQPWVFSSSYPGLLFSPRFSIFPALVFHFYPPLAKILSFFSLVYNITPLVILYIFRLGQKTITIPETSLATVPLTFPNKGYRQVGKDDILHMLLPQRTLYPNSKIYVPVFLEQPENEHGPISAIVIR